MAVVHSFEIPAPPVACSLVVTATFKLFTRRSSGVLNDIRVFMTQSGVTTFGPSNLHGTTAFANADSATPTVVQHTFSVAAGAPCVVGVDGVRAGVGGYSLRDITITVEEIRR